MNHNQLFKDLLSCYFLEFLELFAPEVLSYCDPTSLEFVDKEVFADLPEEQRGEADLCARLRFQGEDRYFLLHVEHEAQHRPGFGERMFRYYARLYTRYLRPVYPLALLSYSRPRAQQPDHYRVKFVDLCPVEFRYRVVQLNRLDWRDFIGRPNPAAATLMTRMHIAAQDRPRVKLECLRILAGLRLERSRLRFLIGFVEQYLALTPEEAGIFQREMEHSDIQPKERRAMMDLTNSWEQKGLERGLEQGREEGLEQGLQLAILRLACSRFQPPESDLFSVVNDVHDAKRLTRILDALCQNADLAELRQLLSACGP